MVELIAFQPVTGLKSRGLKLFLLVIERVTQDLQLH